MQRLQRIYYAAVNGGRGQLFIAVGAVEHQKALEFALLLPHGDHRQRAVVPAQSGSHHEPLGGIEREHRRAAAVPYGDGGFRAAFVIGGGHIAVGVDGDGDQLALHLLLPAQALPVHHIQRGAADIVGHSHIAAGNQIGVEKPDAGLVQQLTALIQHTDLVGGHRHQTAVQRGKAAGGVVFVVVQLGAAGLVLLRPGVNDTAAQPVKAVGVPQHRRGHRPQHHQHRQRQPQPFVGALAPLHPMGRLLLQVAQREIIQFFGVFFHGLPPFSRITALFSAPIVGPRTTPGSGTALPAAPWARPACGCRCPGSPGYPPGTACPPPRTAPCR